MKKLNLHRVEEELFSLNLKVFRPCDLEVIFGANSRAVAGFLHYNAKKGAILRLKKGLYAFERNLPADFVLANLLYQPSYVSLDTALSHYHLIPETVYAVTSVTTKPTREFGVQERLFEYRKIKKQAYTGYFPQDFSGEVAHLASPEKAVADFLYFVYLGKRSYNDRLRWGRIKMSRLRKYLKLFGQRRLIILAEKLSQKR